PMQIYCKDFTGDFGVTALDYLAIFGEYGQSAAYTPDLTAPLGRACLDGAFYQDGYVDLYDMLEWDWFLSVPERLNYCDIPLAENGGSSSESLRATASNIAAGDFYGADDYEANGEDESFLVASKQIQGVAPYLQDRFYLFDQQGQLVDPVAPPFDHMGGQLVPDKAGGIYQINMEQGLVSLWNPNEAVVPPGEFSIGSDPRFGQSASVSVGLQQGSADWYGRPIVDAAFDAEGYVYVLPVVVTPAGNPEAAYQAGARLELNDNQTPPYTLVQIYDDPPLPGDNQQRNSLREIEVDDQGNVYIINSNHLNESDILWVYDAETAVLQQRVNLLDLDISAPIGMYVSEAADMLYLGSSRNSPDAGSTKVYGLATDTLNQERLVEIEGMGHVTSITEDPATGTIWVAGFRMVNIPLYPKYDDVFYYSQIAEILAGNENPVQAAPLAGGSSMTVPISMVWIGNGNDCGGADMNNDKLVDLGDFEIMVRYWLDINCTGVEDCSKANLDNTDGLDTVNLVDFAYFTQYWLWLDC
ncbi:MAG: hypothetical protein GY869_30650, partial [Planctomycetes bacterium]|nr:hypothetical protein [Planctomycetota bacterium]